MDSTAIFIAVLVGIGAIVPMIWKYALTKSATMRKWLDKTELDELAIGAAAETYETYVRDIKASADDGKLTSEEKKAAMSKAVDTFKGMAKDKGVKAAKDLAVPIIKGLIEKGINKLKGDARSAKPDEAPPAA